MHFKLQLFFCNLSFIEILLFVVLVYSSFSSQKILQPRFSVKNITHNYDIFHMFMWSAEKGFNAIVRETILLFLCALSSSLKAQELHVEREFQESCDIYTSDLLQVTTRHSTPQKCAKKWIPTHLNNAESLRVCALITNA